MTRATDLMGQRFGRLTVVERVIIPASTNSAHWLCRCDCGGSVTTRAQSLLRGLTQSCGCLRKHRQPFRRVGADEGRTPAEKLELKREWRRKKMADIAAGKKLTVGENRALTAVLKRLANSPATIADIAAAIGAAKSTANNYCQFLLLRQQIEVAGTAARGSKIYRIVGSGDEVTQSLTRYDGAELALALGYVALPIPTGGRIHLLPDDPRSEHYEMA